MNTTKHDMNEIKEQHNEFVKERDLRERNELKQQCADTITNDKHQHEEAIKEIKEAVACSVHCNTDFTNLNKALDAAMVECKLIWSKYENVCNENKKLSEDLSSTYNKNKELKYEIKSCRDEIKILQLNNESLKCEISSVLHDRYKAVKKCYDYQEFLEIITTEDKSHEQLKWSHLDYGFNGKRENKNDSQEQEGSSDLFSSCQNEYIDNLDQANQEIERLKKLVNQYYDELVRIMEEADISKRSRDWAIQERDKLVLDSERLRILCNGLRKQRDDAFNKLAHAMRDFDYVTKQKNDYADEQYSLKEKMGAKLKNEDCSSQLQATSHLNQDSAVDADLQDSDTEILDIDIGVLDSNKDIGIDLFGGIDDPLYSHDDAIYISFVNKGSLAEGKLRVNDCILRVNDLDCTSISKELVLETMKKLSSAIFVVKRKKPDFPSKSLYTTESQSRNYINHGIILETGIYVKKISPGSIADRIGNLDVGDRVLSINKTGLENINDSKEAMLLLHEPVDILTIKAIKSVCYAEKSDSGPNRVVSKKYTNSSTQTDKSSYSRYQDSYYQEPDTKGGAFDVFETPRNHSLVNNFISDFDEEAISEIDSVINAFTPYSTPTGSPITEHSRLFNPSIASKNQSGTAGISVKGIDRSISSEKDSSTSFTVEFLNPEQMPADRRHTLPKYDEESKHLKKRPLNDLRPQPGDFRWISIEKSLDLEIQILYIDSGELFVAAVSKYCVAFDVGLQIGDQILEVNGIDLRHTTYQKASNILKHCGNSVTMLVQFNPDKMFCSD